MDKEENTRQYQNFRALQTRLIFQRGTERSEVSRESRECCTIIQAKGGKTLKDIGMVNSAKGILGMK